MQETAPERVVALVREGRKIEAIKIVREQTGASLKEALHAVEALESQDTPEASGDVMEEVRALAAEGRTIEAIKVLRQGAGLDLKEAKDVVDAMPQPPEVQSARVLLSVLVAMVLLAAAVGFLVVSS